MTKLEYFFTEEEEKRCRNEEGHELLPILEVPPYIPFDFDAFALIERYALLTTKEYYFDCQFEEDAESKTVIISNGFNYLPPKIAKLVLENGWFCLCIRQISANKPYSEEVSLIIYYNDIARIHFADMIHPAGACSEIFISIHEENCSYLCSYNSHPLAIGNDDDFACSAQACTKRLGTIDYIDERGIDYLAQCLEYRIKQLKE